MDCVKVYIITIQSTQLESNFEHLNIAYFEPNPKYNSFRIKIWNKSFQVTNIIFSEVINSTLYYYHAAIKNENKTLKNEFEW